jgi:hypothetical protein
MAFQITEVQKALKGVDYPASKDELADHAERNGADRELGDALRGMARAHSTHQGALRVLQAAVDRAAAPGHPQCVAGVDDAGRGRPGGGPRPEARPGHRGAADQPQGRAPDRRRRPGPGGRLA